MYVDSHSLGQLALASKRTASNRKTHQVVRPCDEDGSGAHSEKNARCGHTREKKKRAAKPKLERCV